MGRKKGKKKQKKKTKENQHSESEEDIDSVIAKIAEYDKQRGLNTNLTTSDNSTDTARQQGRLPKFCCLCSRCSGNAPVRIGIAVPLFLGGITPLPEPIAPELKVELGTGHMPQLGCFPPWQAVPALAKNANGKPGNLPFWYCTECAKKGGNSPPCHATMEMKDEDIEDGPSVSGCSTSTNGGRNLESESQKEAEIKKSSKLKEFLASELSNCKQECLRTTDAVTAAGVSWKEIRGHQERGLPLTTAAGIQIWLPKSDDLKTDCFIQRSGNDHESGKDSSTPTKYCSCCAVEIQKSCVADDNLQREHEDTAGTSTHENYYEVLDEIIEIKSVEEVSPNGDRKHTQKLSTSQSDSGERSEPEEELQPCSTSAGPSGLPPDPPPWKRPGKSITKWVTVKTNNQIELRLMNTIFLAFFIPAATICDETEFKIIMKLEDLHEEDVTRLEKICESLQIELKDLDEADVSILTYHLFQQSLSSGQAHPITGNAFQQPGTTQDGETLIRVDPTNELDNESNPPASQESNSASAPRKFGSS